MIRDLSERAARTFLAAFAPALALAPVTDLSAAWAAVLAAAAAGASAVLSMFAAQTGVRGSASFDPRNRGAVGPAVYDPE